MSSNNGSISIDPQFVPSSPCEEWQKLAADERLFCESFFRGDAYLSEGAVKRSYFWGELIPLVAGVIQCMFPKPTKEGCFVQYPQLDEAPSFLRDLSLPGDAKDGIIRIPVATVTVTWLASVKRTWAWPSKSGLEVVTTFRFTQEILKPAQSLPENLYWVPEENWPELIKAMKKLRSGNDVGQRKGNPARQADWIRAALSRVLLGFSPS